MKHVLQFSSSVCGDQIKTSQSEQAFNTSPLMEPLEPKSVAAFAPQIGQETAPSMLCCVVACDVTLFKNGVLVVLRHVVADAFGLHGHEPYSSSSPKSSFLSENGEATLDAKESRIRGKWLPEHQECSLRP